MPEKYELKQMQSLPLEAKVAKTEQRIFEWYNYWGGQVYISYSGGKDSAVLRDIVKHLYSDVPAVYIDTGLEYPEVKACAKKYADVILRPTLSFKEVIDKYGYPVVSKEQSSFIHELKVTKSEKLRNIRLHGNKSGRGQVSQKWLKLLDAPFDISDKCCDVMKKTPAKTYEKQTGRKPMIATMTDESALRETNWMTYGCNAFDAKRPHSNPMSFWTEQDVLQYIVKYNVEIPSVYGEIIEDDNHNLHCTKLQRTGCMFCMFGAHLEKEPNRFQRMKQTHPQLRDYCMKPTEEGGLGLREVCEYIGVKVD